MKWEEKIQLLFDEWENICLCSVVLRNITITWIYAIVH